MKGMIFILLACLIWAFDTLIRYPLLGEGFNAQTIVFNEHLFLCIVFSFAMLKTLKKLWAAPLARLFDFIIIGAVGSALATICFTKAFSLINPSIVILLQKLQPIIAIILARLILKEKMKESFFIWAFVCLVGGILISYQDISIGIAQITRGNIGPLEGYLLTLIAVCGWGASTVFGKRISNNGFSIYELSAGRFLFGFLALIPFFLNGEASIASDLNFSAKIAGLVALSGIIGMLLYYKGLKLVPARLCTLLEMFFPFCAIIVNWIFLGKSLTPMQLSGGFILAVGASVIRLKKY